MDGLDTIGAESSATPIDLMTTEAPETQEPFESQETIGDTPEAQPEGQEGGDPQPEGDGPDSPFTTKFAREYREQLAKWAKPDPNRSPEENALVAKVAKQARDNHGRLFELNKLEPNGVDGVREKYAIYQSLGDVTQVQQRMQGMDETDTFIKAGDPRGLEGLDDTFTPGLAKLTPTILDRIQRSDPEAYSAAILPHLYSNLIGSPLVSELNRLVGLVNAPSIDSTIEGLDPSVAERIQFNDARQKMQNLQAIMGNIGKWFTDTEGRVEKLKAPPSVDPKQQEFEQQRTEFEQRKQAAHWSDNIQTPVNQFAKSRYDELFAPYQSRLKLSDAAKADLMQAFAGKMGEMVKKDQGYQSQMKLYRGQKTPDPSAVLNYIKSNFNRNAKSVVESVVTARYGNFLSGPRRTAAPQIAAKPADTGGTTGSPKVVAARPQESEVLWKSPQTKIWANQYHLKNGSVIQVRQSA